MKKILLILLGYFAFTALLPALSETRFALFVNQESDHGYFMVIEAKKALSRPLRMREVRMTVKNFSNLDKKFPKEYDRIALIVPKQELTEPLKAFIEKWGEDSRVFV